MSDSGEEPYVFPDVGAAVSTLVFGRDRADARVPPAARRGALYRGGPTEMRAGRGRAGEEGGSTHRGRTGATPLGFSLAASAGQAGRLST